MAKVELRYRCTTRLRSTWTVTFRLLGSRRTRRGRYPVCTRKEWQLSGRPSDRINAFLMIKRRARAAEIETQISNHTFRATGTTIYWLNGGTLKAAQQMAAHESPRTTKLMTGRMVQ